MRLRRLRMRESAIAPISIHTTLSAAEGIPGPGAIDDEARRTGDIHRLVECGLAAEPAHRQQKIGGEDQRRAGPAGDLDEDQLGAQAALAPASCLST